MKKIIPLLICFLGFGLLHSQVNRSSDGEDGSGWQDPPCGECNTVCPPDDNPCTDEFFNEEKCMCEYPINCDCDIENYLLSEGFIPLEMGVLTISEMTNLGGIVDEYAQIHTPLLDINSDIKNHLQFLSSGIPDVKGIVQSVKSCDQIVSFVESDTERMLVGNFILIAHVIVTKEYDGSDTIWFKLYDNLDSLFSLYSKIFIVPLNPQVQIEDVRLKMLNYFHTIDPAGNYDICTAGAVGEELLTDGDRVVLVGSAGPKSELFDAVTHDFGHIGDNIGVEDFLVPGDVIPGQSQYSPILERGKGQLILARSDYTLNEIDKLKAESLNNAIAFMSFHGLSHTAGMCHSCAQFGGVEGVGYMDSGSCLSFMMSNQGGPDVCDADEDSLPCDVNDPCVSLIDLVDKTEQWVKDLVVDVFSN